jgi:hypothetical protein
VRHRPRLRLFEIEMFNNQCSMLNILKPKP